VEVASVGDGIELTASSPTTRNVPTRLLVLIAALGLLVGVLGFVLPHVVGSRDEYAQARQDVVTRASDFAVTFNTYTVKDRKGYQRRVRPLMTSTYYKDFVKITDAMFQVIKDKNQSSGDAKVLSVAVETIDKDSAVAIVAVDTAVRTSDSKQAVQRRFRWKINMRKIGQQWLVSVFDSVPTMQATLGDVTGRAKSGGSK
jgi:Mce-associated membrane protein